MPVGNSDRGVGLGAGEVMLFADYNQQTFDWWHEQIPGAYIAGTNQLEDFDHKGLLENETINLGATIGLSDYWNLSLTQMISERCMTWKGPEWEEGDDIPIGYNVGDSKTVHHRTECSSEDFIDPLNGEVKAYGGYLGDTRINFKYLLSNVGKGTGNRIFLGVGMVVPSNNTLTESPWSKKIYDHDNDNDNSTPEIEAYSPHRHFYLSDGAYKMFFEAQYFKKRAKIPVFWGGALSYEFPLQASDYGFTPSKKYDFSLLVLSGPIKAIKTNFFKLSSIGFSLSAIHYDESKWEGEGKTPNSEATAFIPGVSFLFDSKVGTFGISVQTGEQIYAENPGSIDEEIDISSITLSYRRVLDFVLDRLYW